MKPSHCCTAVSTSASLSAGSRVRSRSSFATGTVLFLREGAVQQDKPFVPGVAGDITAQTWTGITMVGELDRLELRTADGHTLALGVRDTNLAEPA